MEFLKENRTVVIVVVLLVLAYLLWDAEVVRNVRFSVSNQWNSMGQVGKVVAVLVLAAAVYYLYSMNQGYQGGYQEY